MFGSWTSKLGNDYLISTYKITSAHNLKSFSLVGDEILSILEKSYTDGGLGIFLF